MRCIANDVDDGDPSVPRTEKTTAQDCILLSPRNQVYHDPQSSQVTSVCVLMWSWGDGMYCIMGIEGIWKNKKEQRFKSI